MSLLSLSLPPAAASAGLAGGAGNDIVVFLTALLIGRVVVIGNIFKLGVFYVIRWS